MLWTGDFFPYFLFFSFSLSWFARSPKWGHPADMWEAGPPVDDAKPAATVRRTNERGSPQRERGSSRRPGLGTMGEWMVCAHEPPPERERARSRRSHPWLLAQSGRTAGRARPGLCPVTDITDGDEPVPGCPFQQDIVDLGLFSLPSEPSPSLVPFPCPGSRSGRLNCSG